MRLSTKDQDAIARLYSESTNWSEWDDEPSDYENELLDKHYNKKGQQDTPKVNSPLDSGESQGNYNPKPNQQKLKYFNDLRDYIRMGDKENAMTTLEALVQLEIDQYN